MTEQQNVFLKSVVPAAQAAQRNWGVPASVTIAQAILESGWGASSLAKKANNYFGIKATAHADANAYTEFSTTEFVDGRRVAELANFARYASPAACFDAHGVLLALTARYKPAMAEKNNPISFAVELQFCGYSTNPQYAHILCALIRKYDLTQFDIVYRATAPAAPAEKN